MKTSGKLFLIATLLLAFSMTSCKKGCTDPSATNYDSNVKKDDGSCLYNTQVDPTITFSFSHNFNGTDVNSSDFDQLSYVNENGETMSITKLRYSISDVRFYTSSGDSVFIDGYHLIDLSDALSLNYELPEKLATGDYTGIAFTFGFVEADNISGAYADLNLANWGWPDMLGGGYHSMQLEGKYINTATDTVPYLYHIGSATREIIGIDTNFHANYFWAELPTSSFTLTGDAAIEIKMDISQWFKNPNLWDLNVLDISLMMNYNAQVMMKQNGTGVFSLGTITQ